MKTRRTRQDRKISSAGAQSGLTPQLLAEAQRLLKKHYLSQISQCLKQLDEQDVWWRPNPASNSVGNLTLHLAGNVRQWIVSGLGGKPDFRNRDREFREQGPMPPRLLLAVLRKSVREACAVLKALSPADLEAVHTIQKHQVTGFQVISHVTSHFAYHSGQIIFITKMRLGQDLGFTRLPGAAPVRRKNRRLSAI
ncbi:MAG: DUF1572 family protein [Terriglobia bacterium]